MVIDLPFEGKKVDGSWKYRIWERVPQTGSRKEETITELIKSCIGEFLHSSCRQIMPAMCTVAELLELEYRQAVHQSSDQSNSSRKEIEKQPCAEEIEGQESKSRRDLQFNR